MNTNANNNTNGTNNNSLLPTTWEKQSDALSMALNEIEVQTSSSELTAAHIAELSGGDDETAKTYTNMIDFLRTKYNEREKSETSFIIALAYAVDKIDNSEAKDTKTVITMAIPDLTDSYSNYLKAVKSLITYGTNAEAVKYLASFGATKLKALWNKDKAATVLEKLKAGTITPTMTVKQIAEAVTPKALVNTNANTNTNANANANANANTNAEAEAAAKAKAEAEKAKAEAAKKEADAIAAKAEAAKAEAEATAKAEAAKAEAEDAKAEAEAARKMTFDKVINFINKSKDIEMLKEILKATQTRVDNLTK